MHELSDLLQARPEELGPDARPSSATVERDKARQQLQELLRSQRRTLCDAGGTATGPTS